MNVVVQHNIDNMEEHEEITQCVEEIPWSESSIIHDMYETDDN